MERSLLYPDCDFSIWFRSVDEKTTTELPIEGHITGIIPEWINGCFYQNGPGLLDVTGRRVEHLFDAFALIQKFTIQHGHVTYQNRILQSDSYRQARLTGKSCFAEYGTGKSDVARGAPKAESTPSWLLSRIRNLVRSTNDFRTDNALISIYPYAINRSQVGLFAMTETPVMHELDLKTIETRAKFNVSEHLPVVTHCAHPVLLNDGRLINVGLSSSFMGMNYVVFEFPGFSDLNDRDNLMNHCRTLAKISSRWPFSPSYMHTFAVTDHYIILIEQSLCVSLVQMVQVTLTHGPMTDALVWHGNEPVRFRVIHRESMQECTDYTYLTSAFFFLHAVNAYEDGNHLVVDICCYDNADMLKCMTIEALQEAQQNPDYLKQFRARPKRFVLPLSVGEGKENLVDLSYTTCRVKLNNGNKLWIEPELIYDVGCELPQIDYFRHYGKFYRYFYAINSDIDYKYCGAIRKIDILLKKCHVWHERECYVSEPVFLRNPADENEDDADEDNGVLIMSLLRSNHENEVSLVVLDARTMTEIGRVRFIARGAVPKCLHGLWMNSLTEPLDP